MGMPREEWDKKKKKEKKNLVGEHHSSRKTLENNRHASSARKKIKVRETIAPSGQRHRGGLKNPARI